MAGSTICWSCKRAYGECSWSKEYKEVDGWTAQETFLKGYNKDGTIGKIKSYIVTKCPQYVKEEPREPQYHPPTIQELCDMFNVSHRTIFRWLQDGIISRDGKILDKKKTYKFRSK